MGLRTRLRDCLAAGFRNTPDFKGKGRVARVLQRCLTRYADPAECLVRFRMRDGWWVQVDLRSATEGWAFWKGDYDVGLIRVLTRGLKAGGVVLDVGANIGFYAVPLGLALQRLGGRLYAFEPVPSNFERLVGNVADNGLQETVSAHRLALGDRNGEVGFSLDDRNGATTGDAVMVAGAVHAPTHATAPLRRLDDWAEEIGLAGCDLIKADIEGAEFSFLQGAAQTVRRFRPLIVCEFNSHWMKLFGWSSADFADLVGAWDYRLYHLVAGRLQPFSVGPYWEGLENVVLLPLDSELEAALIPHRHSSC